MKPPINYQQRLDQTLAALTAAGQTPRLLLHACCAPCSSYVLEYLSRYFAITLWFYNPNIAPEAEYRFRAEELRRLAAAMPLRHPVTVKVAPYDPTAFSAAVKGLEQEPEGGARCRACFALRLSAAAKQAAAGGYDYVTTTLSISPLKNAALLNDIGAATAEKAGVSWLYADFKKRDGYRRSCELSALYRLYRQNYCGCAYSKREAAARDAARTAPGRPAGPGDDTRPVGRNT